MQVIAKTRGYFDGVREAGDKFNVPEGSRATWFDPVEKPKESKEPVAKVKKEGEGSDETK